MPKGERFYYRHRNKVIDGTKCDEEKLDVCVDGKCLVIILNNTVLIQIKETAKKHFVDLLTDFNLFHSQIK